MMMRLGIPRAAPAFFARRQVFPFALAAGPRSLSLLPTPLPSGNKGSQWSHEPDEAEVWSAFN